MVLPSQTYVFDREKIIPFVALAYFKIAVQKLDQKLLMNTRIGK